MANEIRVLSSLQVVNGNLEYISRPTSFQADQATANGPTPGAISVSPEGTDIDLSELTTPGICRIMNLDASYDLQVGRWDGTNSVFYPFLYLKPGESYVLRLDPDIGEEYSATGTGTTAESSTLRAKAVKSLGSSSIIALVECFDD